MIGNIFTLIRRNTIIKSNLRKTGNTVYGARAMNKLNRFPFVRNTEDFDIYSKTPKKHSKRLKKILNKKSEGKYYYVKQAMHKGTFKLMNIGTDLRKGTHDDYGVADYTKPTRKIKAVKIMGINYARNSERIKDAKNSLKDPVFAFRHEKDRYDLWLMKQSKKMGGY